MSLVTVAPPLSGRCHPTSTLGDNQLNAGDWGFQIDGTKPVAGCLLVAVAKDKLGSWRPALPSAWACGVAKGKGKARAEVLFAKLLWVTLTANLDRIER